MKTFLKFGLVLFLTFSGIQSATAHGGGLDWQGGHNCRVGSCAGTYHCHQAWGGICAQSSGATTAKPKVSKPKVSKSILPVCVDGSVDELSKAHIAMIQSRLKILGYEPGVADGVLGSLTIKTLNQFEKDYGLPKSSKMNIEWDSIVTVGASC